MTTLFWPGDERAGDTFSERAFLDAAVAVETVWLRVLVDAGIAPGAAAVDLAGLLQEGDTDAVARGAEGGGNPVIPLLSLLRGRLQDRDDTAAARWLHRGLTSQDVVDTTLVLLARDATTLLRASLREQVAGLAGLADRHRATPMVGRTLTQHAVPITFGAKAAGWLEGVLDAADDVDRLTFPVQIGGAAGTLSGVTVLTGGDGAAAFDLARATANGLGLSFRTPWHTDRAPITRIGDALARCSAASGRIANDVLTLSRPEFAELAEPTEAGRGGSSAMPQKANPVLSVLIRRAALTAPAHLSLLHLAAADTRDERPDGAWHVEWQPLQLLARHTVAAADQTVALVTGLQVHAARMAGNLDEAVDVDAEARSLGELVGGHSTRADAGRQLVDAAIARAAAWTGNTS